MSAATNQLDFPALQRMRRLSRFWDLLPIPETSGYRAAGVGRCVPFDSFLRFSDWLSTGWDAIMRLLCRAVRIIVPFLSDERGHDRKRVAESLWRDYQRAAAYRPEFLKPYVVEPDRVRANVRSRCRNAPAGTTLL